MSNFTTALQNAIASWNKQHPANSSFTSSDILALTPGCSATTVRRFLAAEVKAGSLEVSKVGGQNSYTPKEVKKHWPDCAMNHGGTACDMGEDCGTDHVPGVLTEGNATIVVGPGKAGKLSDSLAQLRIKHEGLTVAVVGAARGSEELSDALSRLGEMRHLDTLIILEAPRREGFPVGQLQQVIPRGLPDIDLARIQRFKERAGISIESFRERAAIEFSQTMPPNIVSKKDVADFRLADADEYGMVYHRGTLAQRRHISPEEILHRQDRIATRARRWQEERGRNRGKGNSGHSGKRTPGVNRGVYFQRSRSERKLKAS